MNDPMSHSQELETNEEFTSFQKEEKKEYVDDENIPMSSHSWLWKKKRNAIFPTVGSKSESKTGAWIQTDFPSSSQISEEGLRNNEESKSQSNIISWISLPGSVTDVIEEIQAHPTKNIAMEEETGH
ncbi:hypothetical protein L345_16972, partial [Ophiophagus hannah]